MNDAPRLLLADDEETFLHATAEWLRSEGYVCDCAADAHAAAAMLRTDKYDLLIADIRMPGNPDLELVRQVARSSEGLPVIIVTAHAELATAISSLDLPVWGYLRKPIDFDMLLGRIRMALQFRHQYAVIHNQRRRVEDWLNSVEMVETLMLRSSGLEPQVPVNTFLALTMRNIYGALEDLQRVVQIHPVQGAPDACHLLQCPRPLALLEALREAIDVLQKTKSAFKSKELGVLRERLENLVEEAALPASYKSGSPTNGKNSAT